MAKVFISYSRKDIEFAKRLTAELQTSDLDFWIDWEGIPPTVDWWREIEKGIEEADIFLFVISPDSAKSKICGQEIETAVKNGKRIIPVVVREIEWQDTPTQLGHLNYIFFSRDDDFDTAANKLIAAIQTDYEWAATHRRLQVKALDWERNGKDKGFLLRGLDLLDAEQDLATNTSKDPHPTDLQREYVFESRKATDRQRRTTTSISIAAAIALAALAVFGFYQADKATKQAQNSLARQLVAQAQSINFGRNSKQNIAVLLGLQSLKLLTTIDATNLLINNNFSVRPIRILSSDAAVRSVAFSPDAKFVAGAGDCVEANDSANCRSSIFVWDIASGKEIAHFVHDGPVESIVFSPRSNYLFSGSLDHTARLWDIDSKKEVFRVSHDSSVKSIALSRDGKYTLSGDDNGSIRIWDIFNKEEILHAKLDGNSPSISSVAFSPDSKKAAAGTCIESNTLGFCAKSLIRVWDLASGQPIVNMTIEGGAYRFVFSPDGRYLLVGGDHADKTSLLLEIATQKEVARFSQNGIIWSAAFSPDGKYVLLGSSENTAQIWEISSGREIAHTIHDGSVFSVAFSPDGKYAISGSEDGTARVWDAMSGEEIARMTHEQGSFFSSVHSVAFSPDGKYVLSGGSDKTIRLWGIEGANRFTSMNHHQNGAQPFLSSNGEFVLSRRDDNAFCAWNASNGKQVNCLKDYPALYSSAFRADGKYMAWAGFDGLVRIWEAATGKEVLLKRQEYYPSSLAFSPDGKYILAESSYTDRGICLWDAMSGKQVTCMNHAISGNSSGQVTSVAFSPDGRYALAISIDEIACVWELPNGKKVRCVTQKGDSTSVALSPDSQYLVTGGSVTQVWEVSSGNELFHTDQQVSVDSVMFSPDGKYILTRGGNTICVWEVAIKKQVKCVSHDDQIGSAIFSADSKYVVSAGWDGIVRVWETASGQEVARKIHGSPVSSAVFSSDGKFVISGSQDGIVRSWMWKLDDLIDDACSRLTRNLSRAEWSQFIGDALTYPKNQENATCPKLPIEPQITATSTITSTP
jgi:WD40 repeat protein